MNKINLGDEVVDEITGFKGVVVSRSSSRHGMDQMGVQPPCGVDGKIPESFNIDECSLKVVTPNKVPEYAGLSDQADITVALGDVVIDPITQFSGIVTTVIRYVNGCTRMGVTATVDAKGKPRDFYFFAAPRLQLLQAAPPTKGKATKSGGPMTKVSSGLFL